jgi:microfibrillar-associated protein 1
LCLEECSVLLKELLLIEEEQNQGSDSESEEESEYEDEEYSDSDDEIAPRLKPVFVKKYLLIHQI